LIHLNFAKGCADVERCRITSIIIYFELREFKLVCCKLAHEE